MYFLKRWGRASNPESLPHKPIKHLINFKDVLLVSVLFVLNFIFLWPFFGSNYPQINFSTPILLLLSRVTDTLTPFNFAQALGFLVLFTFPLSSLTWYAFFKKLSDSSTLSFLAGLIFLLPWFFLPRFDLFWQKGDGLHSLGLAVMPLVGILMMQFLRVGSFSLFISSFLSVSLIFLISPFSLLNFYLIFTILTFSEMLLGQARIKLLRFFLVCLFAQGFSSFWYHPSFLLSLFNSSQGQMAISAFSKLLPISFFTVPIVGALSFLIFDRKSYLQPLFFALFFSLLYFALSIAEGVGDYLNFPAPDRFLPEFYVGLSIFLAICINFIVNLPSRGFSFSSSKIDPPRLSFAHHASEIGMIAIIVGFLLWPVFSIFSGSPIVSPGSTPQVLGVQSIWWEIPLEGMSHYVGYGITLLTGGATIFLKNKIKSQS